MLPVRQILIFRRLLGWFWFFSLRGSSSCSVRSFSHYTEYRSAELGPIPFHFDNSWLDNSKFQKNAKDWWESNDVSGWEGYKVMRKLKNLKSKIKEWSFQIVGEERLEKLKVLKRIEELDKLEGTQAWPTVLLDERRSLKFSLHQILEKEARISRIKSKIKWPKAGAENTKFFH